MLTLWGQAYFLLKINRCIVIITNPANPQIVLLSKFTVRNLYGKSLKYTWYNDYLKVFDGSVVVREMVK